MTKLLKKALAEQTPAETNKDKSTVNLQSIPENLRTKSQEVVAKSETSVNSDLDNMYKNSQNSKDNLRVNKIDVLSRFEAKKTNFDVPNGNNPKNNDSEFGRYVIKILTPAIVKFYNGCFFI